MTVAELIAKLQEMPRDARLVRTDVRGYRHEWNPDLYVWDEIPSGSGLSGPAIEID